jgi:hypothetical protein
VEAAGCAGAILAHRVAQVRLLPLGHAGGVNDDHDTYNSLFSRFVCLMVGLLFIATAVAMA